MKLGVGEVVVYGTHGIGRVAARDERIVVIELEDGLTVTLPLERARDQLRPLAGEAEMRRIRATLRDDQVLSTDPWLSRRGATLGKLTGGDPVELAQIVSEGAQRERMRLAKGSKPQLSSSEREIFVKARKLLSDEIALARGIEPAAADGWIEQQLARPDSDS